MRTTQRSSTHPATSDRRQSPIATALVAVLALGATASSLPDTAAAAAPDAGRRVDLATPIFSAPTNITNPLFAVKLDQVVQLGAEGDMALRHEITLLDRTRVIHWDGRDIEAIVSQFVAYGDGEILEVATDYFAQADDGSVWYLGEDVTNYEDGKVANHDGTWLAGKDGPGGMIMPADPQVGDVYRPENIPGLVFEEVTVMQTNLVVDGPTGPVPGAILVQERPLDGTLEDKVFAPGYGEFQASVPVDDELVIVAVAVPIDGAHGPGRYALERLSQSARNLFRQARTGNWSRLTSLSRDVHRYWDASSAGVPPVLATRITDVLDVLDSALADHNRADLRQATIELELASLDVEMQYEGVDDVDDDRLEVWNLQRSLHRSIGDRVGATSDRVIIAAIHDRSAN
jgi:hypothetical protein